MRKDHIDFHINQYDLGKIDKENSLFVNSLQSNQSSASTKYRSNVSNTFKDFCLESSFNVINLLLLGSINDTNSNCLFFINNTFNSKKSNFNIDHGKYIYSCIDSFDKKMLDKIYQPKTLSNDLLNIIKINEMNNDNNQNSTIINNIIDKYERNNNTEIDKTININSTELVNDKEKEIEVKIISIGKKTDFASKKKNTNNNNRNLNPNQNSARQSPKSPKTVNIIKENRIINSPNSNSNQLKKKTIPKVSSNVINNTNMNNKKSPNKIINSPSESSYKTLSPLAKENNRKTKRILINKKLDNNNNKVKSPKPFINSSHVNNSICKQNTSTHMNTIQSFALNDDDQKIISKSPSFIQRSPKPSNKKQNTNFNSTYYQFKLKPTPKKNLNLSTDNIFNFSSKPRTKAKVKAYVKPSNKYEALNASSISQNDSKTEVFDMSNDIFQVVDNTPIINNIKKSHYNKKHQQRSINNNNNDDEFNEQLLRDEYRERITARFLLDNNTDSNERFSFNNSKCK